MAVEVYFAVASLSCGDLTKKYTQSAGARPTPLLLTPYSYAHSHSDPALVTFAAPILAGASTTADVATTTPLSPSPPPSSPPVTVPGCVPIAGAASRKPRKNKGRSDERLQIVTSSPRFVKSVRPSAVASALTPRKEVSAAPSSVPAASCSSSTSRS